MDWSPAGSSAHGILQVRMKWVAIPFFRGSSQPRDQTGSQESVCNAGDPGLIPGLGRSPGEENGNPLQYLCLEKLMDRGAWRAIVHAITKGRTWLSTHKDMSIFKSIKLFQCWVILQWGYLQRRSLQQFTWFSCTQIWVENPKFSFSSGDVNHTLQLSSRALV